MAPTFELIFTGEMIDIYSGKSYRRAIKPLLKKDPDLLNRINQDLAASPDQGDTIAGTGGWRKVRFATPGGGKSGGYRNIHLYLRIRGAVVLGIIYRKNEQEDLSFEDKKALKLLAEVARLEMPEK